MFETQTSGNKTSSGEIGLNIRTLASPNVGQDNVSGMCRKIMCRKTELITLVLFHITNFPFLSSNIPSSPAYGVFISQLIRYVRASSSYEGFILRAVRLSNKLLRQGYVKERLRSSLRKFYGQYGDLIKQYEVPSPSCYKTFWMMTIYSDTLHWSGITPLFDPFTDLDIITKFDFLPICERFP